MMPRITIFITASMEQTRGRGNPASMVVAGIRYPINDGFVASIVAETR
jgi:hypothetical protein